METTYDAVVIGAGAAGVFAALRAKECEPDLKVLVLEKSFKPLRKVAISGGGRCNVTHACHDLDWLLSCYPRGGPRLEAILGRFMPEDTVRWFAERGVELKTEPDGRMFPTSDSSQTIIDTLLRCAKERGVRLEMGRGVKALQPGFHLSLSDGTEIEAGKVLLATGGGSVATGWLRALGHKMVEDVPSLFTFCCQDPIVIGLAGLVADPVGLELRVGKVTFESEGPMLITHWGLSGPAVLKLSAFAARALFAADYQAELRVDFLPSWDREKLIRSFEHRSPEQRLSTASPFPSIPKRLWQRLLERLELPVNQTWRQTCSTMRQRFAEVLKSTPLAINGKGVFKEEFVTAGGLPLSEIEPYTMESRRVPGLYIAGELLDVDGITGGFNFQNAWASGYIGGEGLASSP